MNLSRLLSAALIAATATVGLGWPSGAEAEDVNLTFMTFETPALDANFWDGSIARAVVQLPGVTVEKIVSPNSDRNA